MAVTEEPLITATTYVSLLAVVVLLGVGYTAGNIWLPAKTRGFDKFVFVWLVFDGLIHCIFEGAFLYTSTFGRTAFTGTDWTAKLWQEYAKADIRWGQANEIIVSLEILTVLIGGPLSFYIAYLLIKNDLTRHQWLLILSTGELYGGAMTFFPEWLTGSHGLRTDNILHKWIYLAHRVHPKLMNGIWVVIPLLIMVDSYYQISKSFAAASRTIASKKLK